MSIRSWPIKLVPDWQEGKLKAHSAFTFLVNLRACTLKTRVLLWLKMVVITYRAVACQSCWSRHEVIMSA